MCEAGVNVKAMQEILGHSDVETTLDVYAEATDDLKQTEISKFNTYFGNMKPA